MPNIFDGDVVLLGPKEWHGIESFTASVLADNRPALGLLRKLSPDASMRFEGGGYEASMPLPRAS